MENKAFQEDGSRCRLPIAGHGLFLRAKRRDNLRRTSRAEEHRLLSRGRDGVTSRAFFVQSFCSHLPRFLYLARIPAHG